METVRFRNCCNISIKRENDWKRLLISRPKSVLPLAPSMRGRCTYCLLIWILLNVEHWLFKYWINSTGAHDFLQSNMYVHVLNKTGSRISTYAPMYQEDYLTFPWEISEGIIIPIDHYKMWKASGLFSSSRAKP